MNDSIFDFYWSDPHFGHKLLIEQGYRPFETTQEMDETLIKNYNSMVWPKATVAWLGDCHFNTMLEAETIMERLNGHKVLIWGGHDQSFSKMLRMGFKAVCYRMDVRLAGHVCTLSHFPYQGTPKHDSDEEDMRFPEHRPQKKKGQVLIHGHTHQRRQLNGNMINVCVDAWDYKPVPEYAIKALVDKIYGGKK